MSVRHFLVIVALIAFSQTAFSQVISDFAANADGWTAPNSLGGALTYSATGGNPNGYIQGQTPLSINTGSGTLWIPFYFEAPTKFEGNKSAYYGGSIRVDATETVTGAPLPYAVAAMTSTAGLTYYFYPNSQITLPSFGTWTTFDIPLTAATGEWKAADDPGATAVTAAAFGNMLMNLQQLQITGLYRNANVATRFDNVTMNPPIAINTNPISTAVCNGQTATFSALGSNNPGITYRWQFFSAAAGWFDLTNTGGYSNVATSTLSVNTTGNFGAGNYRCRISGSRVNDVFTTSALLTINALPTAPGATGASSCGPANLTLTATGGTAGSYRWYTVSSGGTAIAGQTNATYSTGVITTTANYYVAINNGTCESTRTTVVATINTVPSAPGVTGASGCGPSNLTLTATGGTAGQYRWYTVPVSGTPIAGQTNATLATGTISTTTNYYVEINNGFCTGARSLVVATINTIPAAPGVTGASGCGPSNLTLTATGGTAGQYRWYTVPTGGTAIAGETNATYATGVIGATANYYVSINNGTCESSRTTVVATINTPPTAPGATGASSCGSANLTLTATGGTAGQYRWYTVSSGGTAIAGQTNATYSTGVITTTANYYVAINNGTCESSRTTVVATINTVPSAPGVTGASGCGPSNLTLTATGGTAGQYRWYTVPVSGTAIAGQTNATLATGTISITTNYYVEINNGFCTGARSLVVATINTIPAAPGVTGASSCGPADLTLTATGGTASQYRWYTVPTGGTAIPGETNNTYATGVIASTTNFYVSINNGTCESSRTTVVGTINTPPTAPGATGASRCGAGAITLTATGGTAGQYRWYTVSSGGTAIAGQTNATYAIANVPSTTPYYVAINNGTCESTRTTVVATVNTIPAAPGVTGASGCGPSNLTLTATGGTAGQYRWYTVPTGGIAIAGQTNATLATGTISTTTNYYVEINNGTCISPRSLVVATINTIPAAPGATGASRCGAGAITLNATGGTAGQYRWYTVPTGGTAIAGQTNAAYTIALVSSTTPYYVSINNGTCESARTTVTATVNTIPTAPGVTGASGCGPSNLTLTATGGTAGQYRWYTVPTGGIAIAGQTNATLATGTISTTTNYYVEINNGTCISPRSLVVATINTPPTAPGVTGAAGCGPSNLTLTATGGTAGQYRWYTVPSGGSPIGGQTNATYATGVIPSTTNYYAAIDNGTCISTRTLVVATINIIPDAPGVNGALGCIPSSVTLSATGGATGQYRWYTVPVSGSALSGETNATYTTPVISVNTDYYVSVNDGTCESSRSSVTATMNNPPAPPTTTPVTACAPGTATLVAGGGAAGEYRWYAQETGGTAIVGESSDTYVTGTLTGDATYYVSINNGCESSRVALDVTMIQTPAMPGVSSDDFACVPTSFTLTATGGQAGKYRWYTEPVNGASEVNQSATFVTPDISTTTTYYVAVAEGICESARASVTLTIGGAQCTSNAAPVIETTQTSASAGGTVSLDLVDLISDPDGNLVLSTLSIASQPESGASASIDANGNLVIDYEGTSFTGIDHLTVRVCDSFSACTEQTITIDVSSDIEVYNAVSPNRDGKNDTFIINGIDVLNDTKKNHVMIFNRWGDLVWEAHDYNNTTVVFAGISKSNVDLPSGTYYYKIEFPGGKKAETGYISLKR